MEPTQRPDDVHPCAAPRSGHPGEGDRIGRVILAKAIASVGIGLASVLLALAIAVLGNLAGSASTGTTIVWDATLLDCLHFVLGNVLAMLIGFMLGVLIRASSAAIVAYFVYSGLLPTIFGLLAGSQDWFRDLQPWIDVQYAQTALFVFEGPLTGEQGPTSVSPA